MKCRFFIYVLISWLGVSCSGDSAETPVLADLVKLSSATSPEVAFGARREGDLLKLVVAVEGEGVQVQVGLHADKTVRLSEKDAKAREENGLLRLEFSVPGKNLVATPDGWKKLRMGLAVEWPGGPWGTARLKQRFCHITPAAAHAGLSPSPNDWQRLDLDEMERETADRARQIAFEFHQPMDGKTTIVIENETGGRIRNLISGEPMSEGQHRVVWDGVDETGRVVAPGRYRWRAISHPGLTPTYLVEFCNAPGSNHGTFQAATRNSVSLFFGAPVTEGGWEIIEMAPDGTFRRGFNPSHGHGLGCVALAADEKYLYVAHDGMAWGDKVDKSKPDWKGLNTISVMRVDLGTWETAEFPGKVRFASLKRYEFGPGAATTQEVALAGMTLVKGRLYVADRVAGEIMVVDPTTGKLERTFPLADPVALAASNDLLYAIAGRKLLEVASGTVLAELSGRPSGLWVDDQKRFYVSDAESHVVRVFDEAGNLLRVIGTAGGLVPGAYDPLRFYHPSALVVVDGLLWITEKNRWQPKRLAAVDLKTGQVAKEYFGPTAYGAPGAGFDSEDETRWIGQGTLFQLDFKAKTARPISILGGETGRTYHFWRQDGRTFVIAPGKATWLQELQPNGTLRPLACLSSAHQFAYAHNWQPPAAFIEAFQRDYPDVKMTVGKRGGIQRVQPNHGYGMLWVDRNGDAKIQADEIEFSTAATNLAGSGWGHDFHDLTIRVPAEVGGKKVLVTLKPSGWWPGGAPRYPALNDAVRAAVPIELPGSNQIESTVDRFGTTILNSDPVMRAFAADGRLLWTYSNRWSGVHGSHKAPLPNRGELQGVLFFTGLAPLDERSDVMVMNGNHGRAFVMTTDGLYVDEMFPDVRLMTNPQGSGIGILGGECFGGAFGRSEKDGNYYFQGGGISYRVYRVDGLRTTKRSEGALTVSAEQVAAAERNQLRQAARRAESPVATVTWAADHTDVPTAQWDNNGKFPVTVRATYDEKMLHLQYTVRDESPWVNNGKDWQSLFKTGDGVDLQLGTDPTARPTRTAPVPGDLRLFVAPSGTNNVAVLYRHRAPDANPSESVVFQSPWRSEKVDVVRRLDSARISVQRGNNQYRVSVSVPLAELGLSDVGGKTLRGDFGVIYGDADGTINIFRNYWANKATGLVNDVPGEIMLTPHLWGEIRFQKIATKGGATP